MKPSCKLSRFQEDVMLMQSAVEELALESSHSVGSAICSEYVASLGRVALRTHRRRVLFPRRLAALLSETWDDVTLKLWS